MLVDKLQAVEDRFMDLEQRISDPDIIARQTEWQKLTKEHASLGETISVFRQYKGVLQALHDANEMLQDKTLDAEYAELAEEEVKELTIQKSELETALEILILPKDPNDDKNIIIEIRGGAGGDEAALFAGDLFRMYTKYAEKQGWKSEIMDANAPDLGGFKEVVFSVNGSGAY